MQCENCNAQNANNKIWSPLWAVSWQGPKFFCDKCTKQFDRYSRSSFFFNEEAEEKFKSVEMFVVRNKKQWHELPNQQEVAHFNNVKKMCQNGTHINKSSGDAIFGHGLYVVDGKVWVVTVSIILRLGNYPEVKEIFLLLF